jgi:predicted RNase H-like nuclease (RuvC/YqgF family)
MTTDITIMQTDLDRLAERVEKAAAIVQQLRDDRSRLEQQNNELTSRLEDMERKLQGADAAALVHEVTQLRKEQREWQAERRDVASKVEALAKKLDKLEG